MGIVSRVTSMPVTARLVHLALASADGVFAPLGLGSRPGSLASADRDTTVCVPIPDES